jgi:hypothetical protein
LQQIGQAPNAKLLLMPMEMSGVVSALAGIAELTKNASLKDR